MIYIDIKNLGPTKIYRCYTHKEVVALLDKEINLFKILIWNISDADYCFVLFMIVQITSACNSWIKLCNLRLINTIFCLKNDWMHLLV